MKVGAKLNRYAAALLALAGLTLASCAGTTSKNPPIQLLNDMRQQPKYKPQGGSAYFGDGRAARHPVAGTIARGELKEDDAFHTGLVNGMYVGTNPVKITPELLGLGQQRFNTYCTPCHGRVGDGKGIVGTRAVWIASNLQDDRVKNFSDGDLYDVISHGRRTMPGYRFQIVERDRWAIVAYLRALQRTTSGTVNDVPTELRTELH